MQQPFASAMVHGQGVFTRRGRAVKFDLGEGNDGEWIAVHCGSNVEHLNNGKLMSEVRHHWPDCPDDEQLRAQQGCILGVARFIQGDVSAKDAERACFFLNRYQCSKAFAWQADCGLSCRTPLAYPKGDLQVWHVYLEGFAKASDAAALQGLVVEGRKAPAEGQEGKPTKKRALEMLALKEEVPHDSFAVKVEGQDASASPELKKRSQRAASVKRESD
jgi:hypothetical protein